MMRLSWRSVLGLIALASMRVVANEETSLQSAYVTSFKIYQKAIKIAHQRSLTPDQEQELDRILDEQPNIVYNTLSRIAGHEGQIKQDNDGHIGFIFLNGPLNQSQNIAVDKALIHHHLHFTKQIILLMNLTSDDLQLSEKTEADQKIKFYLFGKLSPASGKASDYINSVNVIYALIRTRLSQLAYKGDLSAKQTISAKKIIHNLNEESVKAMVQLLKLNDTSMSPDELVSMIKTKRTDGSLDTDTELKIKEVVYFKKLFAIKSLVLLLHMDKTDIDLPPEAPQDLIDVIFTPGIEFFSVQDPDESVKVAYENTQHQSNTDFFCMPCFHKAYTQWKCENGIENC